MRPDQTADHHSRLQVACTRGRNFCLLKSFTSRFRQCAIQAIEFHVLDYRFLLATTVSHGKLIWKMGLMSHGNVSVTRRNAFCTALSPSDQVKHAAQMMPR